MNSPDLFEILHHRLVVSCQAEGDSPFNSPEGVAMFAQLAEQNGAAAIRSEGIAKTRAIVERVSLPVIGTGENAISGWHRLYYRLVCGGGGTADNQLRHYRDRRHAEIASGPRRLARRP